MRVEHAAHFGDVLVFTVQLLVALVHAEFPLAGADGRRARAVVAERGGLQGLHSGLPSQRRFTCPGRHDTGSPPWGQQRQPPPVGARNKTPRNRPVTSPETAQ